MQNLSRPSDLNAAVEGQRREGRRGFDDSPGPMSLMFPGHPPGSPFPYPLSPALTGALPGLMSPGIRDDSRLPMLPPTSKFSSNNSMVEMNCYSILIICNNKAYSSILPLVYLCVNMSTCIGMIGLLVISLKLKYI